MVRLAAMDVLANKYFATYAEPEIRIGGLLSLPVSDVAVVVPLREEPLSQLEALVRSLRESAQTNGLTLLAVFVVNGRDDDDAAVHAANQKTLAWLRGEALGRPNSVHSLVLDRASEGKRLPPKQGVGLARKIGNDVAAWCIKTGIVKHPVFGNTDGDAVVPRDYVKRLSALEPKQAGAWLYPFLHVPGGDHHVDEQTRLYEHYLHYYAEGLASAGSPYGFVSLGSVICMDVDRYIAVRGHPKRLAGEDFYILNKIKKLAPVVTLSGDPIRLTSRLSSRVPFGTGQAVGEMIKRPAEEPYSVYDPRSFAALRMFLKACEAAAIRGDTEAPQDVFPEDIDAQTAKRLRDLIDLDGFWPKLSHPRAEERVRRFHDIFDALRTLQYIHHLRDLVWKPVAFTLHSLPFGHPIKQEDGGPEEGEDIQTKRCKALQF